MNTLIVLGAILAVAFGAPQKLGPHVFESRVIDGEDADYANFPYQLYMVIDDAYVCGASYLGVNSNGTAYALTAAHCTDGSSSFAFTGGSSTRGSGETIMASGFVQHPLYNSNTIDYDYSIIALESPFNTVTAIPYAGASAYTLESNPTAVTSGWGKTKGGPSGSISNTLQWVELPLLTAADCQTAADEYSIDITAQMICAGGSSNGGSCNGDSGGPLVSYTTYQLTENGQPDPATGVLIGDVSWGLRSCPTTFPSVFGRVSAVAQWILDHTGISGV